MFEQSQLPNKILNMHTLIGHIFLEYEQTLKLHCLLLIVAIASAEASKDTTSD